MAWRRLAGALLAIVLVAGGAHPPLEARAAPVPVVAPTALLPDASVLASRLKDVSTKSLATTAGAVLTASGEVLYSRDRLMVPASTTKILTGLAAIDVLGADRTFTTKVVSPQRGRLTLVAGGDPFLTGKKSTVAAKPANLDDLVRATAAKLKQRKVTKVAVSFDARLFTGPGYSPSWKKSWSSYTPRVSSLTVDGGKSGARAFTSPAVSTTKLFIKKLKAKGFKVSYAGSARAPKKATLVASVTSASVGLIVKRMLRVSDNLAAETLARHVARITKRPGSFAGGSAAITAWLKKHDLWASGMVIDGGSGLSSRTKVRPAVLARAVGFALASPGYADVLSGLPKAGVSGTLEFRFDDAVEKPGRLVVHAKTGTLKKVAALAGYVTTADGAILTFAFLTTHNGKHSKAAVNWLDRSATVLATCGCRLTAPTAGG